MYQKPVVMNKVNMIARTEPARARVNEWMEIVSEVSAATRKTKRIADHECKACFYSQRIGDAEMTSRRA